MALSEVIEKMAKKKEMEIDEEQAFDYDEEFVADCLKKMLKDEKVNWSIDKMNVKESADCITQQTTPSVDYSKEGLKSKLWGSSEDAYIGNVVFVEGKLKYVDYVIDGDYERYDDMDLKEYSSEEFNNYIQGKKGEVVFVDKKFHHVRYYVGNGVYAESDRFNLVSYSKEEIDRLFCLCLDYFFMDYNCNFGSIDNIIREDLSPWYDSGYNLTYQVVEKLGLEECMKEDIEIAYYHRFSFDMKEDELLEYLSEVYSKYGKYRMAILSSPLYPFGGRICDAKSVEYFIDEFAKELRDECEDCEPEVSYNVRSIITDIVARKNLKKNEYVTLLRDYFYGEWVLQTIHWNEYEDVKCSVEDINNRLEDKINELERKVFKYGIDVTII